MTASYNLSLLGSNYNQGGSGAVARTTASKLQESVSVLDFGADPTGVADSTTAIQNAINYAIYYSSGSLTLTSSGMKVLVPHGTYKTTDTLHLGYGVSGFTSVTFEGETIFYDNAGTTLSCIVPTFNDRPAINVQGGRFVRIKNIAVKGVNYNWLYANYGSITDRSVLANWFGPNITASNNTRYAPYCGISIDAYSGTQPGTAYPSVTYPSFLGSGIAQYNKNFSSNTIFENVNIGGFCVGVMVQPGIIPDGSNGDFVTIRDCSIDFNLVNYADGHADARNPNIYNSRLTHSYSSIDSLTYGNQTGSLAVNANGCSFESVYRILNISVGGSATQGAYSANFSSCYAEDFLTLGNAYAGSGNFPGGVSFTECKFVFGLRSTEYSPIYTYNAPGTILYLRNVFLNGSLGFHNLNAVVKMQNVIIDKLIDDVFVPTSAANKVAKTYSCGLWAQKSIQALVKPQSFYTFFGYELSTVISAIDSNALNIAMDTVSAAGTFTGFPIPWFVDYLTYGNSKLPVSGVASLILNRTTYNLSSVSLSGNAYTFTCNNAFITDAAGANTDATYYVGKGDFVVDSVSGQIFFVTAVSFSGTGPGTTMTATMNQINNVQRTGTATFSAGGSLSTNTGTLTFYNARRYYPSPYRVNFTATSASGAVTHLICGNETAVNFMIQPIAVNDYMISNSASQSALDSVFPKFSKVTAVNINTGSVTINQNARRSYYGETPLYVKVL